MKRWLLPMLFCMLGGCASQVLTIHTLPDETPAADNAAAAANAAAFAEAATVSSQAAIAATPGASKDVDISEPEAPPPAPPVTPADAPPMYTYDPWERLNRFTYRFNARFDEAIFLPVANVYRRAPHPVRNSVHNFFSNQIGRAHV